jgi:hypothetical protein
MNSIVPNYEPSGYNDLRCSVRAWSSGGGERALSLAFSRLIGGEVESIGASPNTLRVII